MKKGEDIEENRGNGTENQEADLMKLYGVVDTKYLVEIAEARIKRAVEMYPIRVEIAEARRHLIETYPYTPFPGTENPEKHQL